MSGYHVQFGECIPCSPGTFKNNSENVLCEACPENHYARGDGNYKCTPVPANSRPSLLKDTYECNDYFYFSDVDITRDMECIPCSASISNAVFYEFDKKCILQKVGCINGFYAMADARGIFSCVTCPSLLPSLEMSIDTTSMEVMLNTDVYYYIQLNAICGNLQGICTQEDKINIACRQHVKCGTGFYLEKTPYNLLNLSSTPSCVACANVSCPAGNFQRLCESPSNINSCQTCTTLSEGQVYSSGCTAVCDKGYYRMSGICKKCEIGKIKAETGDGVCSFCPSSGMYTFISGATSCFLCERGKFAASSSTQNTTACTLCSPGKFSSITGANQCTNCSISTKAPSAGSSTCISCAADNTTYTVAPAGSTTCYIPTSNCTQGLYLPSIQVLREFSQFMFNPTVLECKECPEGMYCPGDQNAYACPRPQTHSLTYSKSNTSCRLFKNFLTYTVTMNKAIQCPENTSTFGRLGADSILACHPKQGYYGLPGKPAKACPRDHYCPSLPNQAITLPIPCPSDSMWSKPLSYLASNCSSTMYPPCRPGYFIGYNLTNPTVNNSACEACVN